MFIYNKTKALEIDGYLGDFISSPNKQVRATLQLVNKNLCKCFVRIKKGLDVNSISKNPVTDKWISEIKEFIDELGIKDLYLIFVN